MQRGPAAQPRVDDVEVQDLEQVDQAGPKEAGNKPDPREDVGGELRR